MCGIAGIFRPRGGPPPLGEEIEPALDALRHRGPDGRGVAGDGKALLGNRRLAVVDPAGGAQPMTSPDGRFAITYNGEVHDHEEHRERLRAGGAVFRSRSDTEVLLALLAREGEAALAGISGLFAFALRDRAGDRLLLGRDAFGIKPLVWARDPDTGEVRFASEARALTAMGAAPPRLDLAALAERLAFQVPLSDRTLLAGVRTLAPGTVLDLDGEGGAAVRRWHIPPAAEEGRSAAEWEERLAAELSRAGRIALRSDRPLGVTLSGGLDSSLVAGLAAREAGAGLRAYTGWFGGGDAFDERRHARRAAEELGIELVEVPIGPADLLARLRDLAVALEGPVAGPGSLPQLVVAERAARDVTVLLGGQGADEVFGGYARHRIAALETEGRLDPDRLPPDLAGYGPLVAHFLAAGRGEPFADRFFRLVHRGEGVAELLGPALREVFLGFDAMAAFREAFGDGDAAPFARMTAWERRTLLPALLHVEDRVTMAHSLESRVPLLDLRVVDLAARIPPRIAFAEGEPKGILRRAARGLAPRSALARRDKMGFPVPIREWAEGPLAAELRGRLERGPLVDLGILDPAAPARLLERAGGHGRHLWFFLLLSEWMAATGAAP